MAHVRKQIRNKLVDVLKAGVPLVNRRVYDSRVYSLTQDKMPALVISTVSESSGLMNMGSTKNLDRVCSISVDVYVRATEIFDDNVDAICVQVEEAIGANFYLDGLSKNTILSSTEIEFNGEAEQPVGIARLTYDVRYVTSITDVESAR